ncbi:unnamed protein product [Auanema sp. JU1783]|nr:unnamed protein product [Auanema sp. JU1783]
MTVYLYFRLISILHLSPAADWSFPEIYSKFEKSICPPSIFITGPLTRKVQLIRISYADEICPITPPHEDKPQIIPDISFTPDELSTKQTPESTLSILIKIATHERKVFEAEQQIRESSLEDFVTTPIIRKKFTRFRDKKYICDVCDASFTMKQNVASHLFLFHVQPDGTMKKIEKKWYTCQKCPQLADWSTCSTIWQLISQLINFIFSTDSIPLNNSFIPTGLFSLLLQRMTKEATGSVPSTIGLENSLPDSESPPPLRAPFGDCRSALLELLADEGKQEQVVQKKRLNLEKTISQLKKSKFCAPEQSLGETQDFLPSNWSNVLLSEALFRTPNAAEVHMKKVHVHKKEAIKVRNDCDECDRSFASAFQLREHIAIQHLKERNFKCDQCEQRFGRRGGLRRHVQMVHQNHLHKCPYQECDHPGYKCSKALTAHIRSVHTNIRPFVCAECEKAFVRKNDLKMHELTHRRDVKFSCLCGNTFRRQMYLKKHQKLLDLVKPNQNQRIFDTISASVANEYAGQRIAFDESVIHSFEERDVDLTKLNQKYRDYLFEGDMLLPTDQLQKIVNINKQRRARRKAFVNYEYPATIWSGGVPYVLSRTLTSGARASIIRAISFWQKETCINFRQRRGERQYLDFIGNDDGCWSTVGKDNLYGRQVVSIGAGCEHFGVTSHELAHALGVFHEQSRWDRDGSVRLNTRVIHNSLLFNFAKIPRSELGIYDLPYDVGSVMHYTPTEFSSNPRVPALLAVDPNLQQTMGQMEGPSFLDVAILNKHYNCHKLCRNTLNCQNGGFINSRNCNSCKCPSGFGGALCQTVASSFSQGCGGTLKAEEAVRRFDITIKQFGPVKEKMCVYHLQAPAGKRILVNIVKMQGRCLEGCYHDGAEFKMKQDYRPMGYRFCCKSSNQRLLSQTNMVPFMVYSRKNTVSLTFEYTMVDSRATFDDPSSNQNVNEETMVPPDLLLGDTFSENVDAPAEYVVYSIFGHSLSIIISAVHLLSSVDSKIGCIRVSPPSLYFFPTPNFNSPHSKLFEHSVQ